MNIYDDIEGWFNWQNLYSEVVNELDNGSVVVEVGSWMGKSIIYLAQKVKDSNKDIKIFAVDIWDPSYNDLVFIPMIEKARDLNPPPDGVKQAVDEFAQSLNFSVRLKDNCWYIRK